MIENSTPSGDKDTRQRMQDVVGSVQEVSINGKFPNGASFTRKLEGEDPEHVVLPGGPGQDYTAGQGSYANINLIRSGVAPVIDRLEGDVIKKPWDLPPSLEYDSQFLIVDTSQPLRPQDEDLASQFAIASYRFEQTGSDNVGRPLNGVSVRAAVPQEVADTMIQVLHEDPDAIEVFYEGVAGGLDEHVTRYKSPRLAVLDLREIPAGPTREIYGQDGYLTGKLAEWYEAGGQIPRLYYKEDTHGDVPHTEKERIADPTPIVDFQHRDRIAQSITDEMRRSYGTS